LDHRVNTIEIYYAGAFDPVTAIAGSPAHRAMAFTWATREEIGVGLSDQNRNWVFHIANRDNTGPFVTGTVFDDVNGNGVMDAGEGLEGVRVKVSGSGSTYTDAGGGYSIETTPGVHRITASGAGFRGTSTAKFTATGYNAGADFISGESRPVIRVYDLCNGLEPTILGTDGRDVIHGTPGDDVIFAGRGRDRIYGGGGDDVICGGGGRDRISAHAGNDIIFGGSGNDIINGNRHNDVIHGGSGTDLVNGRGGKDRLDGGADFDTIDGGPQKDRCRNGETLISCEM
jgi:Ca2+-binding RTX toxin-like protein